MSAAIPPLACPVCDELLERRSGTFACANGHSFDVAKEGYVNLLPPQHRTRGMEGDRAEMLRARRRFLDAGWYAPLLEALVAMTAEALGPRRTPPTVLETGCGEGYYIAGVRDALAAGGEVLALGTDLAKDAARMAASRYHDVLFFVSDVHRRVYLRDASVDLLLDVFAPRDASEFARVLKPGGSAVVVIPGESHLASLRATLGLLEIEPEKERRVLERFSGRFSLAGRTELRFPLALTAEAVRDLVEMGPNAWHGRGADASGAHETEAHAVLLRLERTGA